MRTFHLAFLTLLCTPVIHASVIKPVSATSSIAGDAGSNVNWLLNDNPGQGAAGLQDSTGAALTLDTGDPFFKAGTTYSYRSGNGHEESWTRPTSSGNPVFVFDLTNGGDTAVGSLLLWQYGNHGGIGPTNGGNSTREFRVIFHTEAEGNVFDFTTETVDISGVMDPITGDNTIDNIAQAFFAGTALDARYAAIRIDSNYSGVGGIGGGDRFGLGEVRFATEASLDPKIQVPTAVSGESEGEPVTLQIPITNGGTTNNLNVTSVILGGQDGALCTVNSTLPIVVPPGQTVNLTVEFDPQGFNGPLSASLDLTTDDVMRPHAFVSLSLDVDGLAPEIEAPLSNSYGPVANGAAMQTFGVTVSNSGEEELTIADAFFLPGVINPELLDDFAVVHDFLNNGSLTVNSGDQLDLQFTFDPAGLKGGIYQATLRIVSDDFDEQALDLTILVEVTNVAGSALVAWWPMETNASDASGNGHHGADVGAVSYAAAGAGGVTGGAAMFNGSSRIDVPFDEALNPSSFTVVLWANPASASDFNAAITSRNDATPSGSGYILYNSSDADWEFWSGDGKPTGAIWDVSQAGGAEGDVVQGAWTHLAITYDHVAQTKIFYVNGTAVATDTGVEFGRNLLNDLHLAGGGNLGTDFMFEGMLDDVAIFREVLNPTQINAIRNTGVTGFTGLPQPADATFAITGVSVLGGNLVIGGVSGMVNGQPYHLESSVTLLSFDSIPGSTFMGGDPIPTVPMSGPRLFIRIAEGAAPPGQ
ncbi:LamG domain-containing protein [Luteolibacter arcticus]|uniref:LamG domain-containing protein n=1 Tax=Luteolibacter arcticus TaxID=1581411 RepID=A0ABT3GLC7_9BACT|nr:LamG domain-containing protein [Luteolibacter arcticus]MCW1924325.1 LamG domain-containing protein [Luteolibacter arcticus]